MRVMVTRQRSAQSVDMHSTPNGSGKRGVCVCWGSSLSERGLIF